MKAHFIPRFYLTGFVDPACPPGYEPFLHVLDKVSGERYQQAPKRAAALPDYYVVKLDDGSTHQDLERALSALESVASDIIRSKLTQGQALTDTERVHFSEFVGAMLLRVPGMRRKVAGSMEREGRTAMANLRDEVIKNPGALDAIREGIARSTGKEIDIGFGPDDLDPDDYEIEPTRNAILLRAFQGLPYIVPHIASLGWGVLRAPLGMMFITSDAPVYLHSPSGALAGTLEDVTVEDVELTLPLTRDVALFASLHVPKLEYRETSAGTVGQINIRTATGADLLYSPALEPTGLSEALYAWSGGGL